MIYAHSNYKDMPETHKGEYNYSPSLTIPDMTLSLEELLAMYTRGQTVATRTPQYLGENEDLIPDNFERLDEVERTQLADALRVGISRHQRASAAKQRVVDPVVASEQSPAKPASTEDKAPV